jgi:hypothetical protein
MNAARAAVVAVIACAGVAIPTTSAHADDPLLCGLLTPCDAEGDAGGDDSEPAPIDGGAAIDLGLDADADLGPEVDTDATLDTDTTLGRDGIVATGNGGANSHAAVTTWRHLGSVDATNQFCGVQVVIAASSSANCQPSTTGAGSSNDGLFAVAESVDLCGAQVAVAGSATADCGESAPAGSTSAGSTAAGSSWTLAGTAQEAPVPGPDPDGSGTGAPGTGATGAVGGVASSPAASSPAQTPSDEGNSGTTAGESRGSLPLTGTSVLLFLTLAAAVVATGLVALRSSQIQVRHQS